MIAELQRWHWPRASEPPAEPTEAERAALEEAVDDIQRRLRSLEARVEAIERSDDG